MGRGLGGIVRTPLTSVIMIFEITRDYTIIVPLMISNLIAFFISHKLQRQPIYEALAYQEGVHLPSAHYLSQAERIQGRQSFRSAPAVLSPYLKFPPLLPSVHFAPFHPLPSLSRAGLQLD